MAERPGTKTPEFGPLLKSFRERDPALSQYRLAKQTGRHFSTIAHLESGTRDPGSRELVLQIAEALNLNDRDADRLLDAANMSPIGISHRLNLPTLVRLDDLYGKADARRRRTIAFLIDFLIEELDGTPVRSVEPNGVTRTDAIVSDVRAIAYGIRS